MPFRRVEPSKPAAPAPISVRARTRPAPPPADLAEVAEPSSSAPPSKPAKAARRHHIVDRTGPNWDENGDYFVGRNRPDPKCQWKPGQSGNPAGPKPREKAEPADEVIDEILAPFMTKVNGQPVETTAGVYAINILKAKAAEKDRLSAIELLNRYEAALLIRHAKKGSIEILPEEQAMIDELLSTAGWEALPSVRNRLSPDDEPKTDGKAETDDE